MPPKRTKRQRNIMVRQMKSLARDIDRARAGLSISDIRKEREKRLRKNVGLTDFEIEMEKNQFDIKPGRHISEGQTGTAFPKPRTHVTVYYVRFRHADGTYSDPSDMPQFIDPSKALKFAKNAVINGIANAAMIFNDGRDPMEQRVFGQYYLKRNGKVYYQDGASLTDLSAGRQSGFPTYGPMGWYDAKD